MATTTMHFGPEWMRKQPTPSARPPQPDPQTGPPPAIAHINSNTVLPSGGSTYSAHVTPTAGATPENRDVAHPFRYSKEDMLRIYKETGGRSGLGLEVERWEGIVREAAADPVGLKDPGEADKKLFLGSLNSEMRRRQSTDYLAPLSTGVLERPKLDRAGSGAGGSPLRERFGALLGQRRRDSSDQTGLSIPRKLSTTSLQAPLNSPREAPLPSPRTRTGPGFDGVLGASEPWVSRRRGSESRLTGPGVREPGGANGNVEIKEEPEEIPKLDPNEKPAAPEQSSAHLGSRQGDPSTGNLSQRFQAGHANIPNQSIDGAGPILTNGSNANMAFTEETTTKRPSPALPDTTDLSSIEWSYLDVQGQIQGPFRADIMQTWHDQGYFTPDLLMRRTNLDSDWVSVAELQLRTSGPKIFLSPWIPPQLTGPPGLTRRQDSSNDVLSQQQPFGAPYQPVPARSLRTSTLDSYINGASNQSESPSSSFGAGRFGNGSPDPAGFGGRAGNGAFGEPAVNLIGARRSNYADSSIDPTGGRSPFNNAPARSTSYDNYALNNDNAIDTTAYNKPSFIRGPHDQHSAGSSPFLANATATAGNAFLNGPQAYGIHGQEQQPFAGSPSVQYAQNHIIGNLAQPASPHVSQVQHPQYANSATSASPWGTPDPSGQKRPGPFEAQHPTGRNTTVVQQTSPWERNTRAPWTPAPQPEPQPEAWVDPEHSLTVSNLEQHNQQLQIPQADGGENPVPPAVAENVASEQKPAQESAPVPVAPAPVVGQAPVVEAPVPSKPKRKAPVVKTSQSPQPTTQTSKTPTPPLPSPAPQIKAAWSKEDEAKKAKPSGVALGFREIQEAEAKKAEVRKTADRERERVVRTAVTPSEEVPAFTASWGLPTSQVGRNTPAKDGPSGASAGNTGATTPPVWTSVAKPAVTKKTMKEIQEEEERRKKLEATKEKETIGAAARRAYAETTNKNAPIVPGPAWTTVGASSKSAITTPAARPPPVSIPSTLSVITSSTAPRSATPVSPRPPTALKPVATTPKVEEAPINPSHDFLRWLSESLKGLNSSVNMEDMSSMLLSFPLDADSSTMEIISDLIYANSTVLDGRRFASEFVTKRKVDAASRPKGAAVAGGAIGKIPSIADIVKAQPKPAQNEWGGFKVVNKKKKGGKA